MPVISWITLSFIVLVESPLVVEGSVLLLRLSLAMSLAKGLVAAYVILLSLVVSLLLYRKGLVQFGSSLLSTFLLFDTALDNDKVTPFADFEALDVILVGEEHDIECIDESGVFDGGGTDSSRQLRLSQGRGFSKVLSSVEERVDVVVMEPSYVFKIMNKQMVK